MIWDEETYLCGCCGELDVEALGNGPRDGVLHEGVADDHGDGVVAGLAEELRACGILEGDDRRVSLVVVRGSDEDGLVACLGVHEAHEGLLDGERTLSGGSLVPVFLVSGVTLCEEEARGRTGGKE